MEGNHDQNSATDTALLRSSNRKKKGNSADTDLASLNTRLAVLNTELEQEKESLTRERDLLLKRAKDCSV